LAMAQSLSRDPELSTAETHTTTTTTYNTALLELNLRKNGLSGEGCLRVCHYLGSNQDLEKLNVAGNDIGDEGALGVAALLQKHPKLRALELHRTQLTDLGCAALLDVLSQNGTLLQLDLSFNEITETTYRNVERALKSNTTLKNINLQVQRSLKSEACQALVDLVTVNTTLEQISTLMRVRFEPKDYHTVNDLMHQMNLWLRLNHAGRKRLLEGDNVASVDEWCSALVAVDDDLNGIYYLMQLNPSMFCRQFLLKRASSDEK